MKNLSKSEKSDSNPEDGQAIEVFGSVIEKVEILMEEKLSLDEFCQRVSTTDRRVELIAGFHHWMKFIKKIHRSTDSEFRRLYEEFKTMPV